MKTLSIFSKLRAGLLGVALSATPAVAQELEVVGADIMPVSHAAGVIDTGAACGPHGCAPSSGCHGRSWSFRLGVIFLDRDEPGSRQLISFPDTTPLINADAFGFDGEGGLELSVSAPIGHACDLELRCFSIDNWESSRGARLSGFTGIIHTAPPTDFFALGTGFANATVISELQSFEVMPWFRLGERVRVGAGFRYVGFDDALVLRLGRDIDGLQSVIASDARNDLYGFQVGADAVVFCAGRFSFETAGKFGVYGNDARHNFVSQAAIGFPETIDAAEASDSPTSLVGEVNLTAVYRINGAWSARLGYNFLWIDGIALGTDQLAQTTELLGRTPLQTGVDSDGDVLLHGLSLGLEFRW